MLNKEYDFYKQEHDTIIFKRDSKLLPSIKIEKISESIIEFDRIMGTFEKTEIPIGSILGLRNLSAFIGEVFNLSMAKVSEGSIKQNPHQDGYPDLLIMDEYGAKLWKQLSNRIREKEPFSPFLGGGIEVKATCGDIRSAKWFSAKGLHKCEIGDKRQEYVTSYNWKAHHRETNNLMGIIWDFIDSKPKIVSIFYSNALEEEDWGKTVVPKAGGGRTTSVSIMNRNGIKKMVEGQICIIGSTDYKKILEEKLSKYNS